MTLKFSFIGVRINEKFLGTECIEVPFCFINIISSRSSKEEHAAINDTWINNGWLRISRLDDCIKQGCVRCISWKKG